MYVANKKEVASILERNKKKGALNLHWNIKDSKSHLREKLSAFE